MTTEPLTSVSDSTKPRPYWQPEPCPAWCDNLHAEHDFVDDRRHISRWSTNIVLTAEEPTIVDRTSSGDGPWYLPRELVVWVEQHVLNAAPMVILHESHRRIDEPHLTLAEARQLGEALIHGATIVNEDSETPAAHAALVVLPTAS